MVNEYVGSSLEEGPTLFVELQADYGLDAAVEACRDTLAAHDPTTLVLEAGTDESAIWKPRRELADAVREYYPDRRSLHAGDVAVPLGALSAIVEHIHELSTAHDVPIPTFGHAGDGNVHFDVLVDPTDEAAVAEAHTIYESIVTRGIELGGTATGEHGIGRAKREFLPVEHGETGVATMRAVKDALDPTGTLNPGKVFPASAE